MSSEENQFDVYTCDCRGEVVAESHQQHLHPPIVQSGCPLPLVVVELPPPPVLIGGIFPVGDNSFTKHSVCLTGGQLASEFNLEWQ